MDIVAWVATPEDVAEATKTGVLRFVGGDEPHEHILASAQKGARATGSCVLLTARPAAWLDGFTGPSGDQWGSYISALASAALRRAGQLDREFVEIDIYEFGASTRDPLRELGFEPTPGPPHGERNRIRRARTAQRTSL